MPDTLDNRKRACPNCGVVGTLKLDHASSTFRCTNCKIGNIDPYKENLQRQKTEAKPTKRVEVGMNAYPNPPVNVHPNDLIVETYVPRDKDDKPIGPERKIGTIYCPKPKMVKENDIFDATTPWVKWALYHYDGAIKRRIKYNKDLIRQARREGRIKED